MVLDVGQSTGILAGGVLCFTHGLIQCRIAGLIFRVNRNVIVPRRAINGGHGQGHEERITGAGDIFRDASLHNEIQALLHIGSRSVAGGIRFGHSHAAVLHSRFQRVFHGGGVGSQRSGQLVVQHIAGEVVDAALGLVCFCAGQADGRQHGGAAITVVEAIQHTHLPLTIQQFIVHDGVGHAEVSELHALNGVLRQLVNNGIIMQPSADVGLSIPRTVVAGCGDVVLVDRKGCFLAGVDGRRRICCGKCCGHQAKGHECRQQQR